MPDKTPDNTTKLRPSLTLDVAKYQTMLDAPEVGDDQKADLIEAMWLLVVSFVDLGFEVKPAEICGEDAQGATSSSQATPNQVSSNHSPNSADFASAANAPATKQEAS